MTDVEVVHKAICYWCVDVDTAERNSVLEAWGRIKKELAMGELAFRVLKRIPDDIHAGVEAYEGIQKAREDDMTRKIELSDQSCQPASERPRAR